MAAVVARQNCQARKVERVKPTCAMHSFQIYNANELIALDYLGPLTESLIGKRFIILAIDCFNHYVHANALTNQSTDGYLDFILEYVGIFVIPKGVHTDNPLCFISSRAKKIYSTLGIAHSKSTPTHSQQNAAAERALQYLEEKLNLVLKQQKLTEHHWDVILSIATLSLNTSHHKSLGYCPFEMRFGHAHRIVR